MFEVNVVNNLNEKSDTYYSFDSSNDLLKTAFYPSHFTEIILVHCNYNWSIFFQTPSYKITSECQQRSQSSCWLRLMLNFFPLQSHLELKTITFYSEALDSNLVPDYLTRHLPCLCTVSNCGLTQISASWAHSNLCICATLRSNESCILSRMISESLLSLFLMHAHLPIH